MFFNKKKEKEPEKDSLDLYAERLIEQRLIQLEQSRPIVEKAIEDSKDGILLVDEKIFWNDSLFYDSKNPKAKNIIFAIIKDEDKKYDVHALSIDKENYTLRKRLPRAWWMKRSEKFQELTGVKTAISCGPRGFMCAAKTKEDAVKLAKLAIEAPDEDII